MFVQRQSYWGVAEDPVTVGPPRLNRGVQSFGISGHTGRRVVLGHTLNTQTLTKAKKSHK